MFSPCISDSFSLNSTALAATTALVAGVALAAFELISWLALASVASAAILCYLVSRFIHVLSPAEHVRTTTPAAPLQTPPALPTQQIPLPSTSTPPPAPAQITPTSTAPTELPRPALFQQASTPASRILSRPLVSPATTPLRALPSSTVPFSRNALLEEVAISPQRIENAIDAHALDSDEEEESSGEISEVDEDPVSPPRSAAEPPTGGFHTPPSAANQALVMAQTSGVFESSPAVLPPAPLGAADRSHAAALRALLADPSDESPPPKPQTPERVRSTRETGGVTQTITAKYPSPAAHDAKPARHIQQGIESRRNIVQLYEAHGALITEILDFDEAHPNAMVPGNEFQQALRWIAAKKGELKSQQIVIGKAIDAMRSANLLGPTARETFVRELNGRKIRLDSILDACGRRIQK